MSVAKTLKKKEPASFHLLDGGGEPSRRYRITPDHNLTQYPKGVAYIVGNEGCERFSYYGMNAILWMYVALLFEQTGIAQALAESQATVVVHTFKAGVYALPMIGALVADRLLGKYKTILWVSLIYCAGHVVLSMTEGSLRGMYTGLALIAIGSGGIKPCVSAHVGDQFGRGNQHLIGRVYQLFYFMINFGSFFSTLLTPLFREWWGWRVAFAIPGALMFVATLVFWMGRNSFVQAQPTPGGKLGMLDVASGGLLFMTFGSLFFTASQSLGVKLGVSAACFVLGLQIFFKRQRMQQDDGFLAVMLTSLHAKLTGQSVRGDFFGVARKRFGQEAAAGPQAVMRIISVFGLVSVFWALFDQHSSSWIRQATMMDRTFSLPWFGTFTMTADQIPSVNPVLVMALIPLISFGLYPLIERIGIAMTPLRRMSMGMLIASFAFVAVALLQGRIDVAPEGSIHVAWQLIPYGIITAAEVMVSITGLEFAYSQAPARMKSTVMGFWLLTVTVGNIMVALLAEFGNLALRDFFWTFAGLMMLAGLLFSVRAYFYKSVDLRA